MPLHNYQSETVLQVSNAFKSHRSIMLQMPTGSGKTHVFCEIAKRFYEKRNGRVLVLAHRNELIEQIKNRMGNFGINAGVIKSGHKREEDSQVQIASVQTLVKGKNVKFLRNVSLIIIDEAHHTPSNTYLAILETYQKENTKLLGVTATPLRLDGKGFEKIFDHLICSYQVRWFVEHSYLSPVKHYASDIIKLENVSIVKHRKGYIDYDDKQSVSYYMDKAIMADIIDSYRRFGENKKAIVFAITIKHAEELSKRFIESGYKSCVISSSTKLPERETVLKKFKDGKLQILINVDIFSEGFDCPDIEVVQIARPTKSLVKYLQMVGRATRVFEGKNHAIILDNACLWQDHGLVSKERIWSLEGCKEGEEDLSELHFSDGSSGEEAYKRRIKEFSSIDMVEVDQIGRQDEIIFTKKRLRSVLIDYNVEWKTVERYLQNFNINIDEHLDGSPNDPMLKYISERLLSIIDKKYSSYKALKSNGN